MSKKKIILIVAAGVFALFAFIMWFFSLELIDLIELPSKVSCKFQGGQPALYGIGFSPQLACGFNPAPDAKKLCTTSEQCHYACVMIGDSYSSKAGTCQSYEYFTLWFKRLPPEQTIEEYRKWEEAQVNPFRQLRK